MMGGRDFTCVSELCADHLQSILLAVAAAVRQDDVCQDAEDWEHRACIPRTPLGIVSAPCSLMSAGESLSRQLFVFLIQKHCFVLALPIRRSGPEWDRSRCTGKTVWDGGRA